MKKLLISLILTSFFLLLSKPSSAHLPGQPAFFLINGKYADFHPNYNIKNLSSDVPHDIAPDIYRTNQDLTFEIDFTKFPQMTSEQINNTKFYWKYGDGSIGNGTKNTHIYKQPGKYVLKILAKDDTMPSPQLFESVELTIIPDKKRTDASPYVIVGGLILVLAAGIGTTTTINKRRNPTS